MGIERFEDLECWKTARQLSRRILQITSQEPFSRQFRLVDQIRAAATSVHSNIAEGFGRGGDREFVQFLGHSRGSACEVQSQLYDALDAGYVSKETFDELYGLAKRTIQMTTGLMNYLSHSKIGGGPKFKK